MTLALPEIGRAVRAARIARGLGQEDLAAVAGVNVRLVRELERGEPTIGLGRALAVLNALGLDLRLESGTRSPALADDAARQMSLAAEIMREDREILRQLK